ncbi:MAG TPA: DinB family protein, partial [Ignavibacteriales bacterium]|nr:DinB family protein [Ignavibacteriales bacterium]
MQEADALYNHYITTRNLTEKLCAPLNPEDYVVQPVVDVSPALWHIGHTTWFFETLVLMPFGRNYNQYDKNFPFLFNSYYESLGKRTLRTDRGNITRPGVAEVYKFRKYVD